MTTELARLEAFRDSLPTVAEVVEALSGLDPAARIAFPYRAGDYWRTEVVEALELEPATVRLVATGAGVGLVPDEDYGGRGLDEDEDDEAPTIVVLR